MNNIQGAISVFVGFSLVHAFGPPTFRSGYAQGRLWVRENKPCLYLNAALYTDRHAHVTECPNSGGVFLFEEICEPKVNGLPPYLLGKFRNVFKAK